jgi:uncharacterized membrane protein HdeD (DUF308 family)
MKFAYSFLFIVLGGVIIYRYATGTAHWLILTLGIAFAAFGIYRLDLFRRALMRGGNK